MSDSWDAPTVIRKGRVTSKEMKSSANINKAMASGNVEITRKEGGLNHKSSGINLSKIENDTELFKVKTVNKSVARAICDGRQAKGLTQKALATAANEKPQVVQEYENGKAIPSQAVLSKLERILQVKLRGANIGAPLR